MLTQLLLTHDIGHRLRAHPKQHPVLIGEHPSDHLKRRRVNGDLVRVTTPSD
jgi:hypothetical protein